MSAEGWETAWSPFLNLCLSPPIVIEPGETVAFTLHVFGGLPGGDLWPKFDSDDPSGVYRIVWDGAVFGYSEDAPSFGRPVPLEQRVSNAFTLEK